MYDCSKEVLGYHDDETTLPQKERNEMRGRRNANRDRVKKGLEKNKDPKPLDFHAQGSYAMKTMVQHPEKGYDIDDGIYFAKDDLKGPKGGEKSALDARQMVRDAVDDGCFKTKPEARKNCVRIYYDAGYHVDMPVYREVVTLDVLGDEQVHYELAASVWKRSDARDVTEWFVTENKAQSPDDSNGRQMRRITRDIKKFSQSRASWKGRMASGFMITKLVTECYKPNLAREDTALYDTMLEMRNRLDGDLVVAHPVTPNETITKGDDDPKARFLKEKLSDALEWLDVLFSATCTKEEAMKAWDKVYYTDYFTDTIKETKSASAQSSGVLNVGIINDWASSPGPQQAVKKEGGGRYA